MRPLIRWRPHLDLSAMHVAWAVNYFPACHQACGEDLVRTAAELGKLSETFGVPQMRFWETAFTVCVDSQANRDFSQRMHVRLGQGSGGTSGTEKTLEYAVAEHEAAFRRKFPKYAEEIPLRLGPLQQQWEAVGPGIMRQVGALTEPQLVVESADVLLVQPVLGGWGYPHLQTNRAHLEAVLTNDDPMLPETLRIAWLLGQLDFERPAYSDLINQIQLRKVAGMAMVVPTLLAGQELGLCVYDESTVTRAIESWQADFAFKFTQAVAQVVMAWWDTYTTGQPDWRIGLTGLDRMLTEA